MSSLHSASAESAIVARLRAAGCVYAEDEAQLLLSAARTTAELTALVDQRVSGLPLEQILGWTQFCGLRIVVAAGVFVPRRRTEFLVEQATRRARGISDHPLVVIDMCCGSGAAGVALVAALTALEALDRAELHATDIDPAAVQCARENVAAASGVSAHVYRGDLFQALPDALRGRADILIANVPYVPTDAIELLPPEARLYEPRIALDGGVDGLQLLRRVAAEAPAWLATGGHLLVETSDRQAPVAAEVFVNCGLVAEVASCDELGATVVIGTKSVLTSRLS